MAAQKIDDALHMRDHQEDRALVLAKALKPVREVRRKLFTRFERDPEISRTGTWAPNSALSGARMFPSSEVAPDDSELDSGTSTWRLHAQNGHPEVASEVPVSIGGPSRTRTLDPLIKSQLLYQLS